MRPEDATAESEFNAILRVGGLHPEEVDRLRLEQGTPEICLSNYSAIIAGGSPYDISTPEGEKSRIQRNIEGFYSHLFQELIPADFPFLGCCSGNGLLGWYCGARISRKYAEPIGGVEITVTPAGATDPLLIGFPGKFTAWVGHKEACDFLPQGAVLLATSESCPIQMFRLGRNIYATQFHPEADAGEFILRIETYKDYGYFDPDKARELIESVKKVKAAESAQILARFVSRYHRLSS